MEPVYVEGPLSFLDRVHFFSIQNEEDDNLQHAIEGINFSPSYSLEGIISMVEGITVHSKKQTSILMFFIVKCFL